MSARRPDEVTKLHQNIVEFFQQDLVETEIFLPWAIQQLRGEIYTKCQVLNERSNDDGTFLKVRTEPDIVKNLLAQLGVVPSELDED
jgi:GTPase